MKRRLLASVGLVALAVSSALAADTPRSMPPGRAPLYVPYFSWNGIYFGINGGYSWGQWNWTDTVALATGGDFDVGGGLFGGTLGYNWQSGMLVFGIEGDFDWSNIKGSTAIGCATVCETANDWLATVRGRIGLGFDRFLPYVSAGLAYGRVKGSMAGVGGFSDSNLGWAAGGGLEYAFISNLSAKIEYLYVDLGTTSCGAACPAGSPFDVTFQSHLFRVGLNYKF